METNKKCFEINIMARVSNVTTEAFWMWKQRGVSNRKKEDAVILEEIKVIYANSKRTYGSPRVKAALLEEQGKSVSRTHTARLMREAGLQTKYKKRFVITTKSNHQQRHCRECAGSSFQIGETESEMGD